MIVKIIDYIEKVLEGIPVDFEGNSVTPSSTHLFDTNVGEDKLYPDREDESNHIIAKNILL